MKTILLFVLVIMSSCASRYEARDLDDSMKVETKGVVNYGRVVGLNDKKEVVVQETTPASLELRAQEDAALYMVDDINHEDFWLQACRRDLADPRLSGNGELPAQREIDDLKNPAQLRVEMGLDDNGDLVIVKQSYLALNKATAYTETLRKILGTYKKSRQQCEWKMAIARRNIGLPSGRMYRTLDQDIAAMAQGQQEEVQKVKHNRNVDVAEKEKG